jgi:hypothetical protein
MFLNENVFFKENFKKLLQGIPVKREPQAFNFEIFTMTGKYSKPVSGL